MHQSSSFVQRPTSAIAAGILLGVVISGTRAAFNGGSGWVVVVVGLFTGLLLFTGSERQSNPGMSIRGYWPSRF